VKQNCKEKKFSFTGATAAIDEQSRTNGASFRSWLVGCGLIERDEGEMCQDASEKRGENCPTCCVYLPTYYSKKAN
jgi:hypothetical protein